MGQLVLEHGLDALVLRLDLTMQLLALGIQLLLEGSNLLGLLPSEFRKLMFHHALLLAQLLHLPLKHLDPIRNVILHHVGVQCRQNCVLDLIFHLAHACGCSGRIGRTGRFVASTRVTFGPGIFLARSRATSTQGKSWSRGNRLNHILLGLAIHFVLRDQDLSMGCPNNGLGWFLNSNHNPHDPPTWLRCGWLQWLAVPSCLSHRLWDALSICAKRKRASQVLHTVTLWQEKGVRLDHLMDFLSLGGCHSQTPALTYPRQTGDCWVRLPHV